MTTDLAKFAKDNGVKYFMISFTDMFGGQRAKLVPARAIADMQEDGAGFAGSRPRFHFAQNISQDWGSRVHRGIWPEGQRCTRDTRPHHDCG